MARPDPARLEVWKQFLRTHRQLVQVLTSELEHEHDLPLPWYEVLLHLANAPDRRLRMGELADAILLSRSGLSRLIDRMVEAEYVARESYSSDRRVIYAVLTPKGRAALRQAAPTHLRGVDEHFAQVLTDDDVEVFAGVFARMLKGLDARVSGAPMPPCD